LQQTLFTNVILEERFELVSMSFRTLHKLYITLFFAPETFKINSRSFRRVFFIIFKSRRFFHKFYFWENKFSKRSLPLLRNLPFNSIMLSNVGFNLKSCCWEVGKPLPSMKSIFWIMVGSQVRVLKNYCLVWSAFNSWGFVGIRWATVGHLSSYKKKMSYNFPTGNTREELTMYCEIYLPPNIISKRIKFESLLQKCLILLLQSATNYF